MYDSLLYGYGLTLAIFNTIQEMAIENGDDENCYFDVNDFLHTFLHSKEHKRIVRSFNRYFVINSKTQPAHDVAKTFLISNEDEIYKIGFERWISSYISSIGNDPTKDYGIIYIYILYNYWYHLLFSQILQKPYSKDFLRKAGSHIKNKLNSKDKIYTTNFDTILDDFLSPKHLHGIFALPLVKLKDILLEFDRIKDEFEYIYLLGTSGVEKQNRLNIINGRKQNYYNLDLLLNENLQLGHLLIYGMSFGYNKIISDDYLEENPEHEDFYWLRSVDGHILRRLNTLFLDQRIQKITLSYYTREDLENLQTIIEFTDFASIVEFKKSNQIFQFDKIL